MRNTINSLFLIAVLLLGGCKKDLSEDSSGNKIITNQQEIKTFFRSLSVAPGTQGEISANDGASIPIGNEVEIKKEADVVNGVPGFWVTTTRDYKMTASFDETILLDPTVDILYPGCVLRGNSIHDASYAALTDAKVGAVTFSISKVTDKGEDPSKLVKTVENIRLSDYRKTFSEWAKLNYVPSAVTVMHAVDAVNSKEEVELKVGASFKHKVIDIAGKFNFNYQNGNNHILAKFIQKQFSVTMDMPKTATIFSEIDTKSFTAYAPVYISNINYGRLALMSIDTKHSLVDIETALNFAVKAVDVNAELSTKYKKILEDSKISIVCVGGGATEQNALLIKGWDGFKEFMTQDIPMEKMSPISFQMRYAVDNSLARAVLSSTYKVTKREFVPEFKEINIEMQVVGLRGDAGITETGADLEVFGKVWSTSEFGEEQILFEKQKNNYISIKKGGDFVDISAATAKKSLLLKKPSTMSLEKFLQSPVKVYAHFYDNDAPSPDKDYGESYVQYTIADLINFNKNKENQTFEVRNDGHNNKVHAKVKVVNIFYNN